MKKNSKSQLLNPGDILCIPYSEGAVYGRVIYCDSKSRTSQSHRRGLYLEVLDCEVSPEKDMEMILESSVMLGPLHCTEDLVKDKIWKVVDNVTSAIGEPDLPYFLDGVGIVDYFYQRVPDTPMNRDKVVDEFIVPPEWVVSAIQAKRGLEAWRPGYDCMLPKEK